jgi:amino acid transporter
MGAWSLAALGVNSIIGAGFYLLPAQYYAVAGAWTPAILLLVGAMMFAIALCFAEVGSRFSENGGAYLYVRSAFGAFAGFEVAWVLYLSRLVATASMIAALLMLLRVITGLPWGLAESILLVVPLTVVVAGFSIVGGRANAGLVTTLAVMKIGPVLLLLAVGLPQMEVSALAPTQGLELGQLGAAAAMALFSYAGFENLAIPAGEARDPKRDVPRALCASLAAGVILLVGANAVAIGLVPDLAASSLALADAARQVMGPLGWWLIAVTALVAVVGSKAGSLLANSRLLQSLADQGQVPAVFGRRSRRFGTPSVAVVVSAVVVVALALSGSFASLVVLSVGTRVLVYASVALAALRLRADRTGTRAPPARFEMPAPRVMVAIVLTGCGGILLQSTPAQLLAIGAGLLAGLVLFGFEAFRRRLAGAGPRPAESRPPAA